MYNFLYPYLFEPNDNGILRHAGTAMKSSFPHYYHPVQKHVCRYQNLPGIGMPMSNARNS